MLVISVGAAIFAARQAIDARKSASAAEDQAVSSRRSADIAEEQLEIMRQDRAEALLPKTRLLVQELFDQSLFVGTFLETRNLGADIIHIDEVSIEGHKINYLQFGARMTDIKPRVSFGKDESSMLLLLIRSDIVFNGNKLPSLDSWKQITVIFCNEANGRLKTQDQKITRVP